LWRLKLVEPSEDETEEDELWRRWATAWLVSVLSLFRFAVLMIAMIAPSSGTLSSL
jgi:hypothetical protein